MTEIMDRLAATPTDENDPTGGTRRRPWWRKKRLLLPGVGLAAVGTAAAAAFLASANLSGGGTSGTYTAGWTNLAGATSGTPSIDTAVTTAQVSTAGSWNATSLTIPSSTFYAGDVLQFTGYVKGTSAGYVAALAIPGLPSGYRAELVKGCGSSVTPQIPAEVAVKITRSETSTATGSWTTGAGAGVMVTPGAAPAGVTCPAVTVP